MSDSSKTVDIIVPKWGLTMEEAEISQWVKSVGDRVDKGEPVVEIVTDKAEGEVESEVAGVLIEVFAEPGQTVEPGEVIGRVEVG